jgi:hypothetical protein
VRNEKDFAENEDGKIYPVDGQYVRAKCGGVDDNITTDKNSGNNDTDDNTNNDNGDIIPATAILLPSITKQSVAT